MRIAFLGSPDFAVPALLALHGAGHDLVAVYSQPPRPAGRGHAVRQSPVHAAAERLGLPVRTPARLRGDAGAALDFAALDLDAAVVAAYGLILPPAMLEAPRRGCLNIHASLLPHWRGASPIQAALLAGDAETGITIMLMDAGLDTGPMLLRQAVPIGPRCTAATLQDRLAELGASMILTVLRHDPPPAPQPDAGVSYAPRLTRADGRLDWQLAAAVNERRVRALNPWPGTWTLHDGDVLKVISAEIAPGEGPPGTVLDDRLTIACGEGALRLLRVQRPGKAAMAAGDYVRGRRLPAGAVLGS